MLDQHRPSKYCSFPFESRRTWPLTTGPPGSHAGCRDISKAIVTVSEVQPTGDNVTAKVIWSQSLNGTGRTTGSTVTLPTSLSGVPTTSGLILGEATYAYTPNLGYTISGTVTLRDSYYLYPRQTNFVPTITSGTTPPVPTTSCPTS